MHTNRRLNHFFCPVLLSLAFLFLLSPRLLLSTEHKGWEAGSKYNSYYDYKEMDKLKGNIKKFKKVVPLPGMEPATAFILEEGDEEILVHLCPQSFADAKETGLRRGIKTKVKGSWAYINEKDVFMASKVKQGEHFEFKVRLTKDGTPFWTMTAEKLAREKVNQ